MKLRIGALSAMAAFILAGCPEPEPVVPPPPPAVIVAFTADAARIGQGESVTLRFETRDAESVTVRDQLGQELEYTGTAEAGEVTVSPTASTLFVLRATAAGGRDSAFVQVAVDEDLSEVSLFAVPPEVEAGQEVDLIWTAPNAKSAVITADLGPTVDLNAAAGGGVQTVVPTRSTVFTLSAAAASGEALTASTTVKVSPVVKTFTVAPHAARAGETLILRWSAAGASRVVITETIFGELEDTSDPLRMGDGELAWEIPAQLPGGAPTADGTPLEFHLTVTQTDPAVTLERVVRGYVGRGLVLDFEAPEAVTLGHPLNVGWSTRNAVRLQLQVDGLAVFEPRVEKTALISEGEFTVTGLTRDSLVELVAVDYLGGEKRIARQVTVVNPPVIAAFTVPSPAPTPTEGSQVQWTTQEAHEVVIRAANGPVLFSTRNQAQVASGQTRLRVARLTDVVLEAWNKAGQKVEARRTLDVSDPGTITATPDLVHAGTEVTVSWVVPVGTSSNVAGVIYPTPIKRTAGNDFIDISLLDDAKPVAFPDPNESVVRIRRPIPFRFPFMGVVQEAFFVSTNGFLTFERTEPFPQNADLASSSQALPAVIAPFWDDLDLGDGEVLHAVVGEGFPRILVVQWNGVSTEHPDSKLTFQVQLEETGVIRFAYRDLVGGDTGAEAATIGIRRGGETFSATFSRDPGAPAIVSGDSLTWFDAAPESGTFDLRVDRSSRLGFFTSAPGAGHVYWAAPVEAFSDATVALTEVMPVSLHGTADGRWVEVANLAPYEVNLRGLALSTSTATEAWVMPELVVPPFGFAVVGASLDADALDGAPVDATFEALPMNATDSVDLLLGSAVLGTLSWENPTAGTSVVTPQRAIDAAGVKVECQRTLTFGVASVGSPGAANERCFEYALQSIPGSFEDLSLLGTQLPTSPTYSTLTLEVPFRYFGEEFDVVRYSGTAGFLAFGPALTATQTANKALPSLAMPRGTVAPFWDALTRPTAGAMYVLRRAGATIISWQGYAISGGTGSLLNFQVKLLDDGAIEFHYGELLPSTSTSSTYVDRHSGVSATTWLERPDGTAALPININTAGGILPFTGYRFTPVK